MPSTHHTKRPWIGHWLMLVAIIHTVVGLWLFQQDLLDMARLGLFDTVEQNPRRAGVAFFMFTGFALALLAHAVTGLERAGDVKTQRTLGVGLLLIFCLGVLLMPASGFWLFVPAVWKLLRA